MLKREAKKPGNGFVPFLSFPGVKLYYTYSPRFGMRYSPVALLHHPWPILHPMIWPHSRDSGRYTKSVSLPIPVI